MLSAICVLPSIVEFARCLCKFELALIRYSLGVNSGTERSAKAGDDKRKLMDLLVAVCSLTSSPSTGEDRGEGALNFYPLTLTLSRQGRQGRENRSLYIVQQIKVSL